MGRYVIRRLLQMIPVFIGATLLIFLMVNVMGDPIAGLCGDKAVRPRHGRPAARRSSASTSRCGSST